MNKTQVTILLQCLLWTCHDQIEFGYCLYLFIIVTTGSYGGRIDKKGYYGLRVIFVSSAGPRLYSNNNVFYEALAWELKDVWHPRSPTGPGAGAANWASWLRWNGCSKKSCRISKMYVSEPRHPNSLVKSIRMGTWWLLEVSLELPNQRNSMEQLNSLL